MSVYTKRFVANNNVGAWQELVAVPAGETWIVRDVELVNGGTTVAAQMQLSLQGSGGSSIWLSALTVPIQGHVQWEGRVALNPGDQIWGTSSAGQGNLTITGYTFPAT